MVAGGYSISRVKGDVFKGKPHEDCWLLIAEPLPEGEEGDAAGAAAAAGGGGAAAGKKKKGAGQVIGGNSAWKWEKQKPTGDVPEAATGVAMVGSRDKAYAFGGVVDEEEEDAIKSTFQQNFLLIKLGGEKLTWHEVAIESEMVDAAKGAAGGAEDDDLPAARKGKKKGQQLPDMMPGQGAPSEDEADAEAGGGGGGEGAGGDGAAAGAPSPSRPAAKFYEMRRPSMPSARISTQLAITGSELFMYGGTVEAGVRQITLSDLHSIDLKKLNQWTVHHGNDKTTEEWLEEESSSDDSDSEEEDEDEAPKKKGKGKKKGQCETTRTCHGGRPQFERARVAAVSSSSPWRSTVVKLPRHPAQLDLTPTNQNHLKTAACVCVTTLC